MDERKSYAVGELLKIAQKVNYKALEHRSPNNDYNDGLKTALYEAVEIILNRIGELEGEVK